MDTPFTFEFDQTPIFLISQKFLENCSFHTITLYVQEVLLEVIIHLPKNIFPNYFRHDNCSLAFL